MKVSMTLLKTTSYAVMHMVVAILVAYAWSRSWVIALGIGLIEPCVQTVAFFFHEMAWHRWAGAMRTTSHRQHGPPEQASGERPAPHGQRAGRPHRTPRVVPAG